MNDEKILLFNFFRLKLVITFVEFLSFLINRKDLIWFIIIFILTLILLLFLSSFFINKWLSILFLGLSHFLDIHLHELRLPFGIDLILLFLFYSLLLSLPISIGHELISKLPLYKTFIKRYFFQKCVISIFFKVLLMLLLDQVVHLDSKQND